MPYILCVYYSRTGNTEKLMREIAAGLKCEAVKLDDGVNRAGLTGWMRSGMQAMSRRPPQVALPKTANPEHMKDNAQVDFAISGEDMDYLAGAADVDYGKDSAFPVFSGR